MAKLSLSYPETWLTISISIKNRDTWIEEFSGVMTEISKLYKYDFVEVAWIDYIYVATCTGYDDMTGVIYSESTTSGGLTTEEHDKLMWISWWGWYVRTWLDAIDKKYLKETHEKVITLTNTDISGIENTLNEIDSHNSLATERIIDTIKQESIEVSSDIIRKSKDLEASNVKTRNLVRQKTEKIDKNVSKLSDRQELIDKLIEEQAEEIEEELERIYEQESDMIENELNSQFEKEANDIESNLS